jgi:hypothetical protein
MKPWGPVDGSEYFICRLFGIRDAHWTHILTSVECPLNQIAHSGFYNLLFGVQALNKARKLLDDRLASRIGHPAKPRLKFLKLCLR